MVIKFSLIPFRLLYFFSDLLRFIVKNLFGYRVNVIDKNLAYVFPDKTISDRKDIRNKFYKNFIDVTLESIKGLSHNPKKLIPKFKLHNPELLQSYFDKGQHVILYSQHYNNWEWGPLCLGLQVPHHIVGIVKKLSNPHSNAFIVEGRSGNNVSVIYTYETSQFFESLENPSSKPKAIVFISDQMPYGQTRSVELPLFGQKSKFHLGAASYACESSLPVFCVDVHRKGRGLYELELVELAKDVSQLTPESLTEIYKNHLEELINKSPESWLWSHKRFKGIINYK